MHGRGGQQVTGKSSASLKHPSLQSQDNLDLYQQPGRGTTKCNGFKCCETARGVFLTGALFLQGLGGGGVYVPRLGPAQRASILHVHGPECASIPYVKGGSVCPARYFSINYPDSSPRFTLSWISPPLDCTPSLQSKLHNKAIAVNSTTPNVICVVLNKQHCSHKCGCQYI